MPEAPGGAEIQENLFRFAIYRDQDAKGAALTRLAGDPDFTSVGFDNQFWNIKAKARSGNRPAPIDAVISLEDLVLVFFCNPDALIFYFQ